MHVLIATDGTLDAGRAAAFATALAGADGSITVLTLVEINRNLLRDLRGLFGERVVDATDQDAEYVGMQANTGEPIGADWPGDDEMLTRYLEDQKVSRTQGLVDALEDAGANPAVEVREGPAAAGIIDAIDELAADVVCVGARGKGVFKGLLGSTSTRLVRHAPASVLIIR